MLTGWENEHDDAVSKLPQSKITSSITGCLWGIGSLCFWKCAPGERWEVPVRNDGGLNPWGTGGEGSGRSGCRNPPMYRGDLLRWGQWKYVRTMWATLPNAIPLTKKICSLVGSKMHPLLSHGDSMSEKLRWDNELLTAKGANSPGGQVGLVLVACKTKICQAKECLSGCFAAKKTPVSFKKKPDSLFHSNCIEHKFPLCKKILARETCCSDKLTHHHSRTKELQKVS